MLEEAGALGGTVGVWGWYRGGRDGDGGDEWGECGGGKVRYNSDDSDGQVYTHHRR